MTAGAGMMSPAETQAYKDIVEIATLTDRRLFLRPVFRYSAPPALAVK